jgi:hypothetical protein
MKRLGLEEFDDWDFFLYIDGVKTFGPKCKGEMSCHRGGDPEPEGEYVEFEDYDGSISRIDKDTYTNNTNDTVIGMIPRTDKSRGITHHELALRESFRTVTTLLPKGVWPWTIFVMDDDIEIELPDPS